MFLQCLAFKIKRTMILLFGLFQLFVIIEAGPKKTKIYYNVPHNLRMVFPTVEDQTDDWVRYLSKRAPYMSEMTICAWEKNLNPDSGRYFVSYSVTGDNNHFLISTSDGQVDASIDGTDYVVSSNHDVTERNHFCISFSQSLGKISVFVNGMLKDTVDYTGGPNAVKGGGVWVFGQKQGTLGGAFTDTQSFSGNITNFVVFRRVLTRLEVYKIAYLCVYPSDPYFSPTFRQLEWHGEAFITHSTTCPKINGPGQQ